MALEITDTSKRAYTCASKVFSVLSAPTEDSIILVIIWIKCTAVKVTI